MSAITAAVVLLILRGAGAALPRTGLPAEAQRGLRNRVFGVVAGWLLLVGGLGALGVFDVPGLPPRPMIAMVLGTAGVLFASFSAGGRALLRAVPLHALVYLQAFRIAVELVLWMGYQRGIIPEAMSFEGRNWDLLIGLAALPAGYLVQRGGTTARVAHVAFNVLGLVSLGNIAIVATQHMPGQVPSGTVSMAVVGTFPFVYLPAVLVLVALAGHLLSLRQLALARRSQALAAVEIQKERALA
ncbi:hypothetical protein GCM10023184_35880 [Flaviaesturariibacter amylovorans]|uniref:MFS transporter n=2 Tax=Flaviaesturariibacter amylovorans TaxID=1084520 RepID=A0ABP8HGT7_9BACT